MVIKLECPRCSKKVAFLKGERETKIVCPFCKIQMEREKENER